MPQNDSRQRNGVKIATVLIPADCDNLLALMRKRYSFKAKDGARTVTFESPLGQHDELERFCGDLQLSLTLSSP